MKSQVTKSDHGFLGKYKQASEVVYNKRTGEMKKEAQERLEDIADRWLGVRPGRKSKGDIRSYRPKQENFGDPYWKDESVTYDHTPSLSIAEQKALLSRLTPEQKKQVNEMTRGGL